MPIVMVAGATGTRVHPMKMVHVVSQEEVAGNGADPTRASRPFDLKRSGMVLGEGAGAMVLEELLASARPAVPRFMAKSSAPAPVRCRPSRRRPSRSSVDQCDAGRLARRRACKPADVGHIHAHGLSTRSSDIEEARAIREVFGTLPVPVTAAKSYFGNLGAGSGVVELIASVLAIEHGRLFPVRNYETPDPECNLSIVTGNDTSPGQTVLNINVTPQGQASAIVARKFA